MLDLPRDHALRGELNTLKDEFESLIEEPLAYTPINIPCVYIHICFLGVDMPCQKKPDAKTQLRLVNCADESIEEVYQRCAAQDGNNMLTNQFLLHMTCVPLPSCHHLPPPGPKNQDGAGTGPGSCV